MRSDQAALSGSSVTGESPYGLCVFRFQAEDGIIWYGHQGRWEGLLTDLFVEPDSQTVVVFVMNGVGRSNTGKGVDGKAEKALLHIYPWLLQPPKMTDDGLGFVVEEE